MQVRSLVAAYAIVFLCNQSTLITKTSAKWDFSPLYKFPHKSNSCITSFLICLLFVCLNNMCDLLCFYAWMTLQHLNHWAFGSMWCSLATWMFRFVPCSYFWCYSFVACMILQYCVLSATYVDVYFEGGIIIAISSTW